MSAIGVCRGSARQLLTLNTTCRTMVLCIQIYISTYHVEQEVASLNVLCKRSAAVLAAMLGRTWCLTVCVPMRNRWCLSALLWFLRCEAGGCSASRKAQFVTLEGSWGIFVCSANTTCGARQPACQVLSLLKVCRRCAIVDTAVSVTDCSFQEFG